MEGKAINEVLPPSCCLTCQYHMPSRSSWWSTSSG